MCGNVAKQEGDLVSLEQEERRLSLKRRRLQERIDFRRAGGGGTADLEQLEYLREAESVTSRRRRDLHLRIDEMRAAAGLPPYRDERAAARVRLAGEE